jgi:hypothetical protein
VTKLTALKISRTVTLATFRLRNWFPPLCRISLTSLCLTLFDTITVIDIIAVLDMIAVFDIVDYFMQQPLCSVNKF